MHKQGPYTVCDQHPGERTALELSKAIARQKQFKIHPAPNAKPLERDGPFTFEEDEGALLNFIAQQAAVGQQYQDVTSGFGAAIVNTSSVLGFLGFAGQYLYDLIAEGRRPSAMLTLAKTALRNCADKLIAHQVGFGFSPSATKSTNARWGAIRSTSSSSVTAYEVAFGGLTLLYAYRVLPDIPGTLRSSYLTSAKAAASYLANLQALGRVGVSFPSTDAGGTNRLYTGAVMDSDAGNLPDLSGTSSAFSASGLSALLLWNELKTTDGDQQTGADVAIAGSFVSAPQQLLSQCISDVRAFWLTGTFDALTRDIRTGLSATTPSDFFQTFPGGNGSWNYLDGDFTSGTQVTTFNIAVALFVLYRYEGASSQVTAIDDWLYTFTADPEYATPAGTSDSTLADGLTGTFDPAIAPSTSFTVRDSLNSFAPIAMNAVSFYDWGSLGLMAAIRATRHASTFKTSRLAALGRRLRFAHGLPSDYVYDRISLRGRSGLSFQTSFRDPILATPRSTNDGMAAAQFGNVFRQAPQAFGGLG